MMNCCVTGYSLACGATLYPSGATLYPSRKAPANQSFPRLHRVTRNEHDTVRADLRWDRGTLAQTVGTFYCHAQRKPNARHISMSDRELSLAARWCLPSTAPLGRLRTSTVPGLAPWAGAVRDAAALRRSP